MAEQENWYGSNYVNDKEFVRRIVWLSQKFPKYKLKFSYFYHSENNMKAELDSLGVPYEIKHGAYHDSYAEGARDYVVFLNPTPVHDFIETRIMSFNTNISEKQIPHVILGTDAPISCFILRTVMGNDDYIYITEYPEKLLREIYDNVYNHHEPTKITLHVYESKRARYNDPYQVMEVTV